MGVGNNTVHCSSESCFNESSPIFSFTIYFSREKKKRELSRYKLISTQAAEHDGGGMGATAPLAPKKKIDEPQVLVTNI